MTFTYAQKYGIVGSVANQSDGSVHIEAQGPTEQLMAFMEVIKRGPSQFAHVNHIEVKEQPLDQYSKFSIQ
ncbi:acylphosphatase [Lactobacillus bombi]|nr:acylphosphatase [Lactobacillus sp. XV13L]MBA1434641.1 acylphosphatase [Bombilactobacillus bombi]